jgi:hypothetical protein
MSSGGSHQNRNTCISDLRRLALRVNGTCARRARGVVEGLCPSIDFLGREMVIRFWVYMGAAPTDWGAQTPLLGSLHGWVWLSMMSVPNGSCWDCICWWRMGGTDVLTHIPALTGGSDHRQSSSTKACR